MRRPLYSLTASCLAVVAVSAPAWSQVLPNKVSQPILMVEAATNTPAATPNFSKFSPRQKTKNTKIDYSIWNQALENVVVDFGPSLRKRASRPEAVVGSRRVKGHTSPYRLEGSRVTFAFLTNEYREGLEIYREELQDLAETVDLTRLSKDQQLVFWLNLHNVAVIEKIANAYPVSEPARIKVKINGEKVKVDEARFIKVLGEYVSPKDIREKIVYPNWDNPNVIYGFFRGDIGSPKMPRYAYSESNVNDLLNDNANEFVNSLRGFHESYDSRKISGIFAEAQSFYFPDLERDLTAHLLVHAERETINEVNSGKPFKIDQYESVIADLSAGNGIGTSGNAVIGSGAIPLETRRLLAEVNEKQRKLRVDGVIKPKRGYVIIEDLYEDAPVNTPTVSSSSEVE